MFFFTCFATVDYVKHGHVKVGPNVVRDPAFVVTRDCEDYVTWSNTMRKKIQNYGGERDDYED
jgi:U3 small nucleolar ribonucleoprotein protein IMP3